MARDGNSTYRKAKGRSMGGLEDPRERVKVWMEEEPTKGIEKLLAGLWGDSVRQPPGDSAQRGN